MENEEKSQNNDHDSFEFGDFPGILEEADEDDDQEWLTLSLSVSSPHSISRRRPPPTSYLQPPLRLPSSHQILGPPQPLEISSNPGIARLHLRTRRDPVAVGKSREVPAPFPWATNYRATVRGLDYLRAHQLLSITGEAQCKKCEHHYEIKYDLMEKFVQVANFVIANKAMMRHRAPPHWINPVFPDCEFCNEKNCVRPVVAAKKKSINWLFLLLGQLLGCCTLEQLKYFCKHNKCHRTGAKDRVLYLTYLGLCKQLDPSGPFDP